jgi:thiol-disulfide isomerase/thioredoxin
LARNGVLVVLGVLATAFGAAGSGVVPAVRDFEGTDWWWLVMAALVAAAAVLVTTPGRPEDQAEVPDEELLDYLREPIPFGILEDAQGGYTTLQELAAGRAQLLVFLSTSCGSCLQVGPHLADWAARLAPVELAAVFSEEFDEIPAVFDAEGVRIWRDLKSGAYEICGRSGRPAAVLLGADGALAGGPVAGYARVAEFVEDILAELAAGDAPDQPEDDEADIGSPGPETPGHASHDHADHEHDHDHDPDHDHDHDLASHDRGAGASA